MQNTARTAYPGVPLSLGELLFGVCVLPDELPSLPDGRPVGALQEVAPLDVVTGVRAAAAVVKVAAELGRVVDVVGYSKKERRYHLFTKDKKIMYTYELDPFHEVRSR